MTQERGSVPKSKTQRYGASVSMKISLSST
jgi:hypothetical protein